MRILIVAAGLDRAEAAIYKGLKASGISLDVVCSPGVPGLDDLEKCGIRVFRHKVRHRLDMAAAKFLRDVLNEGGYDLIYCLSNKCLSASLIASRGGRQKVVGYRGTVGHISRLDPASWLTYLNPRVSKIVCVSDAVRLYLRGKGLPEHKLAAIYKGHDPEWYNFGRLSSFQDFGIPDGSIVAGFVGNIRRVKGVGTLLNSAPQAGSDCHFLLVGDIRDRSIRQMAGRGRIPHNVHFAGYRKDAACIAGSCDIFVMPSLAREGLPRALIEAMAQGVPPVVTRVGGMPEVVEEGVSGLVVEPGNSVQLAEAVRMLAENRQLREAMGQAARKRIADKFNISDTIARFERLFLETVS